MENEIEKLMEYWENYVYLNEDEWKIFQHQLDSIKCGDTYDQVKHLHQN